MKNISAEIFYEGDDFLENLFRDLRAAKKSVYIELYILRYDNAGREFIDILLEKEKEGLDVKFMIDGIGSWDLSAEAVRKLKSGLRFFSVFSPVTLFSFISAGMNRRNHRKLFIIDERIVYMGGMNVKDTISKKKHPDTYWIDSMIRIEGREFIGGAIESFRRSWNQFAKKESHRIRKKILRFGRSIQGIRKTQKFIRSERFIFDNIGLLQRVFHRRIFRRTAKNASKKIYIQTPYFVPTLVFLTILRRKASKGVDVRIMLNSVSDVAAARWAGRATYSFLLRKGVKIYERTGHFSHAKLITADGDTAIIGSSNLDYRSFFHNYEIDLFLRDTDIAGHIEERFVNDLKECRQIIYKQWKKRSFADKLREMFFYIFRFFL